MIWVWVKFGYPKKSLVSTKHRHFNLWSPKSERKWPISISASYGGFLSHGTTFKSSISRWFSMKQTKHFWKSPIYPLDPFGKHTKNYGKIQLFLWPCSSSQTVCLPEGILLVMGWCKLTLVFMGWLPGRVNVWVESSCWLQCRQLGVLHSQLSLRRDPMMTPVTWAKHCCATSNTWGFHGFFMGIDRNSWGFT
jgi:hypothetical protein